MMFKKAVCLGLILSTALLSGCWNNRPVTGLAIVVGMGIDRASNGKILLTVQLVSQSKSGGSSGSQEGNSAVELSAEGNTLFDAVRNILPSSGQKCYYAQNQIFVVGEAAAKSGFEDIWDMYERDHETNKVSDVIIVKNGTAKSVLEASDGSGQLPAVTLSNTEETSAFGKNVSIKAYEVTTLLSQPLAGLVIGAVNPYGQTNLEKMKVEGAAVFKHAKLIGYLNNDETRGYLFACGKLKSTILTVPNPKQKGELVSVEVISSKGSLKSGGAGGRPKLGIAVQAIGNIGDEQGSADLTDEKSVKALEKESRALIARNIRAMLRASQKKFDCDILNFSDKLYKFHTREFAAMKKDWGRLYRDADIGVTVKFTLDRPGLIKKPAYKP